MGVKVIHRKLEQVVRLERRVWLSRAVATLVAFGAIIAACHFALDWSLRPDAAAPRLIFLAGLLAALGYVAWREVWRPLRRFPSHDEVALEVERFFPLLRGRFISSWQLSRVLGGRTAISTEESGSPQLIARLIEETANVVGSLDFRSVPDRRARNRGAAMAAALLLAWIAFIGLTPTGRMSFPVWLQRLANPFSTARYPTKTMVAIPPSDKFRRVARGEDVTLKAHAQGLIPESGSIWIQRGQPRWIEQPVFGTGREFTFVQKAAVESFDYYWRLGDGESEKCHVEVVIPPQVRAITARYEYPAYTRRTPETAFGGNLEGLPGTKVALAIHTNKPVTSGNLVLDTGRQTPLARQAETTYTAGVDISTSRSSYRIRLVDEYGFENRDPLEYAIQPIADEPPHVEIRNLEERKFVTPYAALPLEVRCRDDYGITRAQVHLSIGGTKEETVDLAVRANELDQTVAHTLRLEPYELKSGTEVILWASAFDNRTIGEPQQGTSSRVRLEVVSPEEMVRLMRERMEALFPRLQQIGQNAIESKTSVEDIVRNGDKPTTATK